MVYLNFDLGFLPPPYERFIVRGAQAGFALIFLIITIVSLIPGGTMDALNSWEVNDKLGHFVAYGTLALCGMFAVSTRRVRLAVCGAIALYGGFLEVMQSYVGWDRQGSWGDIVADLAGVLFGGLLALVVVRVLRPLPGHLSGEGH